MSAEIKKTTERIQARHKAERLFLWQRFRLILLTLRHTATLTVYVIHDLRRVSAGLAEIVACAPSALDGFRVIFALTSAASVALHFSIGIADTRFSRRIVIHILIHICASAESVRSIVSPGLASTAVARACRRIPVAAIVIAVPFLIAVAAWALAVTRLRIHGLALPVVAHDTLVTDTCIILDDFFRGATCTRARIATKSGACITDA